MVRGSLNGISAIFVGLGSYMSYVSSGIATAAIVMIITYWAILGIDETFGRDLDFMEE